MKLFGNWKAIAVDVDDTLVDEHGEPIAEVVEYVKRKSLDGFDIILWSQQGGKHAYKMAYHCGIQSYVTAAMTKPSEYVDDLPASAWMDWKKVPIGK